MIVGYIFEIRIPLKKSVVGFKKSEVDAKKSVVGAKKSEVDAKKSVVDIKTSMQRYHWIR